MKATVIRKVLKNKLNNWIDSIEDKQLANDVRNEVLITGGAITSLLLNEKPMDYDVYFKNIDIAESVAEYYAARTPGKEVVVTREFRKNINGEEEERIINFIRSNGFVGEIEDKTDLSIDEANTIANDIKKSKAYQPLWISDNAITLSNKIQLVTRFYGSAKEIHKNYDFIHATCSYDLKEDNLILPEKALESTLCKNLVYTGSLYPVASVFRIRKFLKRGWTISAGQILKMLFQISKVNLDDIDILKDQLIGVDIGYMMEFIAAIEMSKERIDDVYLGKLIDEIFD